MRVPLLGDWKARQAFSEVFSRDVLGAVLVGTAAGKVVERSVLLVTGSLVAELIGWVIMFWVFVAMFAYWHRLEDKASEVKEKADEATDGNNE